MAIYNRNQDANDLADRMALDWARGKIGVSVEDGVVVKASDAQKSIDPPNYKIDSQRFGSFDLLAIGFGFGLAVCALIFYVAKGGFNCL